MDYGKLAYALASDLQARWDAQNVTPQRPGCVHTFPRRSMASGLACPVCTVSATGDTLLGIRITLRREGIVERGRVLLTVGGMAAEFLDVSGAPGNDMVTTVICVNLCGESEIALLPEKPQSVSITECLLWAVGQGATAVAPPACFDVGVCMDRALAVWCTNGRVRLRLFCADKTERTTEAGTGQTASVTGLKDGFGLLFCDGYGNLWGVRYDENLTERTRVFLGKGGDCATVTRCGDRLYAATLTDGKLEGFSCDTQFGAASERMEIATGIRAKSVRFAEGCLRPVLLVEGGGRVYVKVPAEQTERAEKVTAEAYLEGVQ